MVQVPISGQLDALTARVAALESAEVEANADRTELRGDLNSLEARVATLENPDQPQSDPAYLLHHGWDIGPAQYLADNWSTLTSTLPFDGYVFGSDTGTSAQVVSATPIDSATVAADLSPAVGLSPHNFVIIYVFPVALADWGTVAANFGALAAECANVGVGILFDTESYYGDSFPSGANADWFVAGKQAGQAIQASAPSVPVMTTNGLWIGTPGIGDHVGGANYNDVSHIETIQRQAAMIAGIALGCAPGQFHDGCELYALRTDEHFSAAKQWISHDVAVGNALVPDAEEPSYYPVPGFGVFDDEYQGQVMTGPDMWRDTIANALEATGRYVWSYNQLHDWTGFGWPETPVPQEWVDATVQARDIAAATRQIGD